MGQRQRFQIAPLLILQQIEGDQEGRRLRREAADAAGRRMETHLQCLERKALSNGDDQLAIEGEARRLEARQRRDHLAEVAGQALAGTAQQLDRVAVAAGQAAEPVPLGFILPAPPLR